MNPIFKDSFYREMTRLSKYAEKLEDLLATEHAKVYAGEALSIISAKARGDDDIEDEPSEELQILEELPNLIRRALFINVVSAFEIRTRAYVNHRFNEKAIGKGNNLRDICTVVSSKLPGRIHPSAIERFISYKHLRDACAHTQGDVRSDLHEVRKVFNAVRTTPGVVFKSMVDPGSDPEAFTSKQRAFAWVGFDEQFIPQAISFFVEQFKRISK